jgi:hypothetical protein
VAPVRVASPGRKATTVSFSIHIDAQAKFGEVAFSCSIMAAE